MIWKSKFQERINELWQRAKDRDRKMTQVEYARRFGVTRNALLGWLRGSGQPDADGFVRIADKDGCFSAVLDFQHDASDNRILLYSLKG